MASLLPGFDEVEYPDWEALLDRWWKEAPASGILALDEFPYLAASSPELPSLIQKRIDAMGKRGVHLLLCGSSQRMMHGLVLDSQAPLYGRATEILRIQPLEPGWILRLRPGIRPLAALEEYSFFGGIPRYWELSVAFPSARAAVLSLVLDPLGVLHEEPSRLLRDDLEGSVQAASILSLIGEGCHKLSEIAGRLGKPATSLSRPLSRLVELGLVRREVPFGISSRDSKRSHYAIADPFLRLWFGFVSPNRSVAEARQLRLLDSRLTRFLPRHLGGVWEDLARRAVSRMRIAGEEWGVGGRWWGPGTDGAPLEIDVVAESHDGSTLLVGEAKLEMQKGDWKRTIGALEAKAARLGIAEGRRVVPCVFSARGPAPPRGVVAVDAARLLRACV